MTRSHIISAITLLTAALGSNHAMAQTPTPLKLSVYHNPDPKGFQVASVLVTGEKDAILLDAQFTLADAHRVVADVLASGKELKTVFITQGDPDFYFGLGVVKAAFPDVKVLTTPAILKHIQETADKKLTTWGPQLKQNGPKTVVFPEAFSGDRLTLDGQALEIKHGTGSTKDEIYVSIPSIKAVVGGVMVFGNLHVWTADSPTLKQRADWIKNLDAITALKPTTVVPGHYQAGAPQTLASVQYTRDYLVKFDQELPKAKNATELIQTMKASYPNVGLDIALEIGAKVNKGEMKW